MAKSNTVTINILGNADDAKRAFASVSDAGSKMGAGFAKVGKAIGTGIALGAGAAAAGVGALVVDGAKSLVELERIGAQTANVIKSTGGAANVSADQVGKMAENIERLTGIEQEGVREGANLLLTFTNIQNKAGKGNDIFNQSTKILTDMSVALGTDVQSSAIQLGKALNDPVKGVTALTRVGVSFTEQQKEQIKWMVAAGDTAGAQKVILAELNKEFGGSAEAFGDTAAGRMAKFKNAIGDVGETMATALLPVAEKLATFASSTLLPVLQRLGDVFSWFGDTMKGTGDKSTGLVIDVARLFGIMEDDERLTPFIDFFNRLGDVFGSVGRWATESLVPALQRAAEFLSGQARQAFELLSKTVGENKDELIAVGQAIATVASVAGPILVGVLGGAIRGVAFIIGGLIDLIGTVVRSIQWLANTAGWASVQLPMMWEAFKESFKNAINWVLRRWNALEFRTPNLPGFGSVTIGVPDVPLLAAGGIVTKPTLAMVGEAGPEAVVPLSRMGGMGGDITVIVQTGQTLATERDIDDAVRAAVERVLQRGGGFGNGRGASLQLA